MLHSDSIKDSLQNCVKITPTDKAIGNASVVCERFHGLTLVKELLVKGKSRNYP